MAQGGGGGGGSTRARKKRAPQKLHNDNFAQHFGGKNRRRGRTPFTIDILSQLNHKSVLKSARVGYGT